MDDHETLIAFTAEEIEMITSYMQLVDAVSPEAAIMNAISIALDDADSK